MRTKGLKRLLLGLMIAGLLTVIALVLILSARVLREPNCRGMTLSQWLEKSDHHTVGEGIAEIGPDAIPLLIRKLKPPHPLWSNLYTKFWKTLPQKLRTRLPWPYQSDKVRENVLFALKEFGEEAKPALSHVINAARHDPNLFCRTFAMNAAVAIGHDEQDVASLFQELLKDPSAKDSAALAPYNAAIFPSDCLSSFLPLLRDKQKLPYNALVGISVLGPGADQAVPLIVDALGNPQVRGNALTALQRIGPAAAPAVPVLTSLLDTVEPISLVSACEALMNIGPPAASALPALRRHMTNADVTIRIVAAAAVAKISGNAKESVPILAEGLKRGQKSNAFWTSPVRRFGLDHYSFNHQLAAAWLLGELAPATEEVLPILRQTLKDCPEWLAPALARSIWKIEGKPEEVISVLRQAVRAKSHETRVLACATLAEIGPAARDALPDLQAACAINLNTRQAARFATRRIGHRPD